MAQYTQEQLDRAQMVLDGTHPWIGYGDVENWFGLDQSFIYTAETLAQYVNVYYNEHKENI